MSATIKVKSKLRLWVYGKDGNYALYGFHSYNEDSFIGVCMTPEDKPLIVEVEVDFSEDEGRKNALKDFDFKIAEALQNVEIAKEAKQRFLAINAE